MNPRLRTALMAFIFWLVFGIGVVLTLALQLIGIILFAFIGDEDLRDWIYRTGKGTDGINNAAWFGGNPKETISSHTGRWYQHAVDNPADHVEIPLRFRFVRWLTDHFEQGHVIKAIEKPFEGEPL